VSGGDNRTAPQRGDDTSSRRVSGDDNRTAPQRGDDTSSRRVSGDDNRTAPQRGDDTSSIKFISLFTIYKISEIRPQISLRCKEKWIII
jgi:hypothetical protein